MYYYQTLFFHFLIVLFQVMCKRKIVYDHLGLIRKSMGLVIKANVLKNKKNVQKSSVSNI